jgi:transposase InsO family protein
VLTESRKDSDRADNEEELSVRKTSRENLKSEIVTLAIYEHLHLNTSHTKSEENVTENEINEIAKAESDSAKGMCIPIEMYGIPMGHALVDQGATRSIMRQTALSKIREKVKIRKVHNMSVMCSSGETVPIIGCFAAPLSSGDIFLTKTLMYIAANTKTRDIVCDVVVGRASLANGQFPCIDMRKQGTIYHPKKDVRISCLPCKFSPDENNQIQLIPIYTSTEKSQKKAEIEDNIVKMNALRVIVNERNELDSHTREALYTHLVSRLDDFIVPTNKAQIVENARNHEKMCNDLVVYNFMCDMDRCEKGSGKEQEVISAFLSTYVPITVEKPLNKLQKTVENSETDIIKTVEDIDFPFTPATLQINTTEYVEKKLEAIKQRIFALTHLTEIQQKQLYEMVSKHHDRFSLDGENMERTDTVQHEINTGQNMPFRERLRQYSPSIQAIIDSEVVKMISAGVIVPSKSAYASNLLLVRKPDPSSEGGVKNRVCASFVRLNQHTEKDSYPLPGIQYIYDKIGKSKWFTTMDLLSGFWQVIIKPEHRNKTAFITARGLYEFVVMPFGLCNAPATFQRLMDEVVLPEYRDFIETYIDDLMTHSSTFEEHLTHLDILYKQLRKHKLIVKLTKCKFAQLEVKFLGHIISQNSLKTNPETVEVVKRWQRPAGEGKKAVTAIRGFLGTVNWYRKFIPHCADLQRPLINLTRKGVKFEWTAECQKSFEKLRDALTSAPVLTIADPNKHYILHTDASDFAMGAVLMQEDSEGNLRVIAYASKTFNDAQKNYDTTDREALAVVWALEHFNTYCEGHKYTLLTDHQALAYIKSNTNQKKRIHRLAMKLANYDVQLYYKPGKDNHMADLLSRDYMVNSVEKSESRELPAEKPQNLVVADLHSNESRENLAEIPQNLEVARLHTENRELPVETPQNTAVAGLHSKKSREILAEQPQNAVVASLHAKKASESRGIPAEKPQNLVVAGLHTQKKTKKKVSKEVYEVERIVGKRAIDGRDDEYEYNVKWRGYDESENTWEPTSNLQNAIKILVDYEKKQQRKKRVSFSEDKPPVPKHLPQIRQCTSCSQSFVNESAYHIHNFQEHGVKAPLSSSSHLDMNTNINVFKNLQESEPQFRAIFNSDCGQSDYSQLDKHERRMLDQHEFIVGDNELLYCVEIPTIRTRSKIRTQLRLCIPKSERARLLHKYHSEFAHSGVNKLYDMLCERVWWPRMLRDVVAYIQKCSVCQRSKGGVNKVLTRPMNLPTRPWSHVHFDHVGPLPTTDNGNMYILTVVDRFTRYAEAFPVKDLTSEETAKILVEKIICRYGLPEVVGSDRGPVVVGMVLNQVFKILGVKRVKTSAHHAQSNGVVEIFNKTLKQSLRIWSSEHQRDWDELLPFALFAYNTSIHTLLRETPYYLNHGIQARDITDELTQSDYYRNANIHGYAYELASRLFKTHQRVRELLEQANEKREKFIENEKKNTLEVGDQVLLFDPTTPAGVSRKLVRRWSGPYTVLEKHSEVSFTIVRGSETQKVNVKRLRLFHDESNTDITTEQQESELTAAKREIEAISAELQSLAARKQALEVLENTREEQEACTSQKDDENVSMSEINALNVESGQCYIQVYDVIIW